MPQPKLGKTQTKTAQAIVNVFETGRVQGDYGNVTVLAGDTGHLTYGRAQTTLSSGNLALLVHAYCIADGAQFAALQSSRQLAGAQAVVTQVVWPARA